MKPLTSRFLLCICCIALVLFSAPTETRAESEISFSFFYDSLDPYGEWINTPEYGYCWRPSEVDADWSPYVDGYWSYTDAGWTWVSYEDWGGICYHYGRWVNLDDEGWCWVPDYEWGPAWVSWRNSDSYVGWAPLPPEARFRRDVGVSIWADTAYDIGPGAYSFCSVEDFGAPVVREVIIPRHRNVLIVTNTYNITNICYNPQTNFVFCGGPDFTFISSHCRRPVPALKIVQNIQVNIYQDSREKRRLHSLNAAPKGNTLQVFAPVVTPPNNTVVLKPSRVAKVLPVAKVNGGWSAIKDRAEQTELRAALQKQNNGLSPSRAPALPVKPSQLLPVPVKADTTIPVVTLPARAKSPTPAVPLPRDVRSQNTPPAGSQTKPLPLSSSPPQPQKAQPVPAQRIGTLPEGGGARPEAAPKSKGEPFGKPPVLSPTPGDSAPAATQPREPKGELAPLKPLPQSLPSARPETAKTVPKVSQVPKEGPSSSTLPPAPVPVTGSEGHLRPFGKQPFNPQDSTRQKEDPSHSQAQRQMQQQEAARAESLRRQQDDSARSQAQRQMQQQEAARAESLRRQQDDSARSQAQRQMQQQEAARAESLRRQQDDSARSQAQRQMQQQEAARAESLRRQRDEAGRVQLQRQMQQPSQPTLQRLPQGGTVPQATTSVPSSSSSSNGGKKKEKDRE
jgi:hypothetical protein